MGEQTLKGKWSEAECGYGTICVHGGACPDSRTGAILQPIYQSTTFVQESVDDYLSKGYSYTREANPTVSNLEARIGACEHGKHAVCFSSGMAATCTVFASLLQPGDHVVLTNCSYGGTNRAARVHFSKYNIEFTYVDFSDTNLVKEAIKPNTKLIFSESPTNPTLNLADIKAISGLAKAAGVVHCCDSTFAPPPIMKALEHGPDLLIISTTKFYDGHNLTVGGVLVTSSDEIATKLRFHRNVLGNIMAPQTAFYTLVTIKTLHLRVERQSATAAKVAQFLLSHPKVKSVCYPGLPCFRQHDLAQRQHTGGIHGGMVSFEVKDSPTENNGRKLMNSIERPWSLCENLGSTESIITCPSVFTHANMLKEDRLKVGITDGLVRLSCGVEEADDLIRSLKKALDSID